MPRSNFNNFARLALITVACVGGTVRAAGGTPEAMPAGAASDGPSARCLPAEQTVFTCELARGQGRVRVCAGNAPDADLRVHVELKGQPAIDARGVHEDHYCPLRLRSYTRPRFSEHTLSFAQAHRVISVFVEHDAQARQATTRRGVSVAQAGSTAAEIFDCEARKPHGDRLADWFSAHGVDAPGASAPVIGASAAAPSEDCSTPDEDQ